MLCAQLTTKEYIRAKHKLGLLLILHTSHQTTNSQKKIYKVTPTHNFLLFFNEEEEEMERSLKKKRWDVVQRIRDGTASKELDKKKRWKGL